MAEIKQVDCFKKNALKVSKTKQNTKITKNRFLVYRTMGKGGDGLCEFSLAGVWSQKSAAVNCSIE